MTPVTFAETHLKGFEVHQLDGWVFATSTGRGRSLRGTMVIHNEDGPQRITAHEWEAEAWVTNARENYTVAVFSTDTPDLMKALSTACRFETRATSPLDILHIGEPSQATATAMAQYMKCGGLVWIIV